MEPNLIKENVNLMALLTFERYARKKIEASERKYDFFSEPLDREVKVDFYLPTNIHAPESLSLLLINDGQDLVTMGFEHILSSLYDNEHLRPLLCVGIHCGTNYCINEYGMIIGPVSKDGSKGT